MAQNQPVAELTSSNLDAIRPNTRGVLLLLEYGPPARSKVFYTSGAEH